MIKILIIGSGGREHAFGWQLSECKNVSTVFYSPGNGGTEENKGINISIDGTKKENFYGIYQFIINNSIDMTLVGPENPLVDGIVDYLNEKGYNRVFGPSKKASMLEADKFFSFDLMNKLKIPQAESVKCYNLKDSKLWIDKLSKDGGGNGNRNGNGNRRNGIVIKTRGLTGGKGVTVCDSKKMALEEIEIHYKKYGHEVLIAERLFGEEFSVFGISDGSHVYPFNIAFKDHKRLMDNDKGPNTGGMGAFCPVSMVSQEIIMNICKNILTPVIQELKKMDIIYKGFIYAGMIMTKDGPKVLEFNVRFGDPECQPAMMIIKDLYNIISSVLDGKKIEISLKSGAACCIVLASHGYPGTYKTGLPIFGLENLKNIENVKVFHAGTKKEGDVILSNGGRILGITAYSPNNIKEARNMAYEAISKIDIPGGFAYRKDIAKNAEN